MVKLRFLSLMAVLLVATAPSAVAQTVSNVAGDVEFRGYYAESGVDITVSALEDLAKRFETVGFVALVDTPAGGADGFADDVLSAVRTRTTIIVLTASEAGASSHVYDDAALGRAFDVAFDTTGDSYQTDFGQFVAALEGNGTASQDGGGFGTGWVLVIAIVVIGGFLVLRSGSEDKRFRARRVSTARAEITEQMAVIANEILAFSDRVDLPDHPDAVAHYRNASDTYAAAEIRMKTAGTWAELEKLSDDLDLARWEMAAAQAVIEGREMPARPDASPPEPCFFDPTHGAGVEVAELSTPAGGRNVMVCSADAEKLRRGERPEPRTISVAGRQIPAAQAPRSHGGGGFDWLDAFSIIVGGMSDGMGYRWRTPGRSRYRSGGGYSMPGGFGGSMGRGSRGSASRSRSSGRARRSR